MPWWGWMIIGALMLGSELLGVDAAFYLVFIGVAAMIPNRITIIIANIVIFAVLLAIAVTVRETFIVPQRDYFVCLFDDVWD